MGNPAYYHTGHGLLPTSSPISQATHMRDECLPYHTVNYIDISLNTHNITVVTVFQIWTDRTCFRGCQNWLTDINILLCTVITSWTSYASYNINLECNTPTSLIPMRIGNQHWLLGINTWFYSTLVERSVEYGCLMAIFRLSLGQTRFRTNL